jgi:hypothetical protein
MLGQPSPLRLALQEFIPVFISNTISEMQAVRGELANHIFLQPCKLI